MVMKTILVLALVVVFSQVSMSRIPAPTSIHLPIHVHKRMHTRTATMTLRDGVYHEYHTTRVFIGTPPQVFDLIVDTKTAITFVPCVTCEECGIHTHEYFKREWSSTYQALPCSSNCSCNSVKSQCTYTREDEDTSSSNGVLGKDVFLMGNDTSLEPQYAVFGCAEEEFGTFASDEPDGILGLGRQSLNLLESFVENGDMADMFSICYGGIDTGGGYMILGGGSPPTGMVFSYSNPFRSIYYNIELQEIHVAEKDLLLEKELFEKGHGSIVDSRVTFGYFPKVAFLALKDAIFEKSEQPIQIAGSDPGVFNLCIKSAASSLKDFPNIQLVVGGGGIIILTPENYFFQHSTLEGMLCLALFPNGIEGTTVLGAIMFRNTLVTYDRGNRRIGFMKTNCSESNSGPKATTPGKSNLSSVTIEKFLIGGVMGLLLLLVASVAIHCICRRKAKGEGELSVTCEPAAEENREISVELQRMIPLAHIDALD